MPAPVLITDRLRLRLMGAGDGALYRELYTSAAVMRHVMPPLSEAAADAAFESVCRHNMESAPGHRYWAIETRDEATPMGLAALRRRLRHAELGVLLLPPAWNRRIASEAFAPLIAHGFDAMGLEYIDAERADDGQALVIDRLLAPFGFECAPARRAGARRWMLTARRWRSQA